MVLMEFKVPGGFATITLDGLLRVEAYDDKSAMIITKRDEWMVMESYMIVMKRIKNAVERHPEIWLYEKSKS